ncbi:MAG: LysR family transcriptional regulator, partial [Rubrivivax sp.]|nr:LysR family transcriptional regulator [Rubrivivax sp.]
MKPTLQPGLAAEVSFEVDRARTIDFMGEAARVYATPVLVRDIEVACRDLLLAHLDPGEDSVGTRVEIDHLAATLLGM